MGFVGGSAAACFGRFGWIIRINNLIKARLFN